jgi:hypothetical protein
MTEFLNPISEASYPDSGIILKPKEAFEKKNVLKFFCPDPDCKDTERILIVKKSINEKNIVFGTDRS